MSGNLLRADCWARERDRVVFYFVCFALVILFCFVVVLVLVWVIWRQGFTM